MIIKIEHPCAKWLRVIADGESIQVTDACGEWVDVLPEDIFHLVARKCELRIKPDRIQINEYEVPKPMKLPVTLGKRYFFIKASSPSGYLVSNWNDDDFDHVCMENRMCWENENDIKYAIEALKAILK